MDIREKLKGVYTKESLQNIEAQEALLHFESFDSEDALKLGLAVVSNMKNYDGAVVIRITRHEDDLVLFQCVMDPKNQRNFDIGEMKEKVTRETGHNSFWALVKSCVDGGYDEMFVENSKYLPVGGCYPIYVKGTMVADIFVSGMSKGRDYTLLVESLCEVLGREKLPYIDPMI